METEAGRPAHKPMLVELQWVHPCFCINCVQKVHEGSISLVSPLAYGKGFATGLYEIEAGEPIGNFVGELRRQERVKRVEVVEKSEHGRGADGESVQKALVYLRSKPDSLLIETVARTGCVPLEPSLTQNGVDACAIYVPGEKELRFLYSTLKDHYEVKLLSKKYLRQGEAKQAAYVGTRELLELKTLSSRLSPRQFEVFSYASRKGYFDSPKRIDVQEISDNLGLKPATASEHLRKAQAKIMPFVADLMKNLR